MKIKKIIFIISAIFVSLLLGGGRVACQGIYNNGATIVITTGTVIYIDGDANGKYLNEVSGGDGEIDIDGTMIVEGDWTNNASNNVFINPDNDGTVELKGTTTQTIGGTGTTTFENLTINNTAAGISVSLSLDATVGSTLTFTDGVVVTGADTLIMESSTAADLLPVTPTNASFVNGNLKRKISGSQTYIFPLGDGTATTNYKRMDFITSVLDLVGATDYIMAKIFTVVEACPGLVCDDSVNTSEDATPITSVYGESAIWKIITSGVYSSGSYGVNLYVANTGLSAADDDMFTVVKSDDGLTASTNYANWKTFDATTTIPLSGNAGRIYSGGFGFAQKTGFTSFSEFSISKSSSIPLPIELLSFDAIYNKNTGDVDLTWITATEINNDYFTVERSVDATDFEKVVTVPGAGNSQQVLYYAAVDENPYYGISYYRLKQTDYDGKYEFSNIVAVMILKTSDLIIYPNPARDNLTFLFNDAADADALIKIFDVQGKLVYLKRHETVKGTNQINISLSSYSQGMYFVTLITDNNSYRAKFVKEE